MGNIHSLTPPERQGHPAAFYRGVAAVKAARFTVAELCFVEALQEHPSRDFWEPSMHAVLRSEDQENHNDVDQEQVPPEPPSAVQSWREAPPAWLVTRAAAAGAPEVTVDSRRHSLMSTCPAPAEHETPGARPACPASPDQCSPRSRHGPACVYVSDATPLLLPLDGRLTVILDYYRLMADIAATYLGEMPVTRHLERVATLAARYCLLGIGHTHMLLRCLSQWREQVLGDGLGFVDYAKTRGLRLNAVAGADDTGEAGKEAHSWWPWRRHRRSLSTTDSVLLLLGHAEANCRYYHMSLTLSYAMVLMERCRGLGDPRSKQQVLENITEHLDAVYAVVRQLATEYPAEYMSGLIRTHIPTPAATATTPTRRRSSSTAASMSSRTQRMMSLSQHPHRHLYKRSAAWSLTETAFLCASSLRSVQLTVQKHVARDSLTRLRSPAERLAFSYVSWRLGRVFLVAPGCNSYVLERSLPASAVEMESRCRERETTTDASGGVGGGEADGVLLGGETVAPVEASPAQHTAVLDTCTEQCNRRRCQMKRDLDLQDEHTCVVLYQHEALLLGMAALFLSVEARVLAGESEAAAALAKSLRQLLRELCGPDSTEMHLLRELLYSVGLPAA
ncbi:hypothetical protein NESM_000260100 [Novymonas esmeraldas]|uniref:Uncharacterized protein n=1 Tax=Novymonas esmeraldas TaxID=1808958 RepID=A0AAW0F5R8_9TRYP